MLDNPPFSFRTSLILIGVGILLAGIDIDVGGLTASHARLTLFGVDHRTIGLVFLIVGLGALGMVLISAQRAGAGGPGAGSRGEEAGPVEERGAAGERLLAGDRPLASERSAARDRPLADEPPPGASRA